MFKWTRYLVVFGLLSVLVFQSSVPVLGAPARRLAPPQPGLAPSTPNAGAWYDGLIQYSSITNCVSIIQGSPYQEAGAGVYTGFFADPDAGQPAPNTTYYVHVVVGGLGNACSGQRAVIDLALPANTSLAITPSTPVGCFYDNVALPANECPQSFPNSAYNSGAYSILSVDSANALTWPIPQGRILEIRVPVRSSAALTNSPLRAHVWMLDGNSSPWLHAEQGVYVFSSQPTIIYPSPSTINLAATTARRRRTSMPSAPPAPAISTWALPPAMGWCMNPFRSQRPETRGWFGTIGGRLPFYLIRCTTGDSPSRAAARPTTEPTRPSARFRMGW